MNWDKFGKSTTGMMLLFLLRVQDNIILRKWYGETQGPCFDYLEDGDLHIPSETTCSRFYLWTEVCLRAPPFILQLKLITGICCSKFYAGSDSYITYTPLGLLASTDSNHVYSILSKKTNETKSFSKADRLI